MEVRRTVLSLARGLALILACNDRSCTTDFQIRRARRIGGLGSPPYSCRWRAAWRLSSRVTTALVRRISKSVARGVSADLEVRRTVLSLARGLALILACNDRSCMTDFQIRRARRIGGLGSPPYSCRWRAAWLILRVTTMLDGFQIRRAACRRTWKSAVQLSLARGLALILACNDRSCPTTDFQSVARGVSAVSEVRRTVGAAAPWRLSSRVTTALV
ncbi:MAG: hypothetical protein IPJ82_08290 [Lewinellaceae bacterium]|nr:hypothetical protein [Lewinellaceae bacterium]